MELTQRFCLIIGIHNSKIRGQCLLAVQQAAQKQLGRRIFSRPWNSSDRLVDDFLDLLKRNTEGEAKLR